MMKLVLDGVEITGMLETGTLERSRVNVSKSFQFNIVSSPTDKSVPVVNVKLGGKVELTYNEELVFEGLIYSQSLSIQQDSISILAYDYLYPLVKSTVTYNFQQKTPAEITETIFGDLGIPFAGSPVAGDPIDRIFENVNAYDAVMTVWTMQAEKDKKKYMVTSRDGKGAVVEVGKTIGKYVLDPRTSILDAEYAESGEDLITAVNIYDEEGKKTGTKKLESNPLPIDVYTSVKAEEDVESALKDIEKTASVEILGDLHCVSGRGIVIKEEYTGLYGLFFIESDQHTFDNNMVTTRLELAFDKMMDEKDVGGLEDEEEFAEGTSGGGSASGHGLSKGGSASGHGLLNYAKTRIGARYSYGAATTNGAIDCSGLVWRAMQANGYKGGRFTTRDFGRLTRSGVLREIPLSQRQPGDILWMPGHTGLSYTKTQSLEATPPRVGYYSFNYQRWTKAYRWTGR